MDLGGAQLVVFRNEVINVLVIVRGALHASVLTPALAHAERVDQAY